MTTLKMPVRWWGGAEYYSDEPGQDGHAYADLELELERTVFMVVDSDCGAGNRYVEEGIAPALQAARGAGMRVVFIHNDFSLCDEPGSIKREIHGTRWGNREAATRPPPARTPLVPNYSSSIAPLVHEPDFPKREWSGFHETHVDYHLSGGLKLTHEIMNNFYKQAQAQGLTPILTIFPHCRDLEYFIKHKKYPYENLINLFLQTGIKYIDFGPEIISRSKNNVEKFYDTCSGHFNKEGETLVAEVIYKYILENNLLKKVL